MALRELQIAADGAVKRLCRERGWDYPCSSIYVTMRPEPNAAGRRVARVALAAGTKGYRYVDVSAPLVAAAGPTELQDALYHEIKAAYDTNRKETDA